MIIDNKAGTPKLSPGCENGDSDLIRSNVIVERPDLHESYLLAQKNLQNHS